MAGMRRSKELQQAHSTTNLNYGHLGTALFHEDTRQWAFLRSIPHPSPLSNLSRVGSALPFVPVSQEIVIDPLSNATSFQDHPIDGTEVNDGNNRPNRLPPVFGPGRGPAGEEEPISRALIAALEQHDPSISQRLAFGGAFDLLEDDIHLGKAIVPIAAFASGPVCEFISLVQITKTAVPIDHGEGSEVVATIPRIGHGNEAWWSTDGDQVQQICFAATSGYGSAWMAARLRCSTTIFNPWLHKRPVPARSQAESTPPLQHRSSQLDANPVLAIPITRTGGHPHADVAFHPLDYSLVALVDRRGNWSIWKIEGRRSILTRSHYSIHLVSSGKLSTWANEKRPAHTSAYHDGWHRICWLVEGAGTVDRVLVSNRRSAVIYQKSGEMLGSIDLSLGPFKEAQWILDVRKSDLHPDQLLVLTSTRVFWFSTANADGRDSDREDMLQRLCSWHHFRGREDVTCQLTIMETNPSTIVLLSSRINSVVNIFRIEKSSAGHSLQVSWIEPLLVTMSDLLIHAESQKELRGPSTLVLRPLQSQSLHKGGRTAIEPSLFKLFTLDKVSSLKEILFSSTLEGTQANFGHPSSNAILLPVIQGSHEKSARFADVNGLDQFIVEEDQKLSQYFPTLLYQSQPQSRDFTTKKAHERVSGAEWQDIYNVLADPIQGPMSENGTKFSDLLQRLSARLQVRASSSPKLTSLAETIDVLPYLEDVDESSEAFVSFRENLAVGGESGISVTNMSIPHRPQEETILDVYQTLISHWLTPLPTQVPERVRVNKERLARSVAAYLTLASVGYLPADPSNPSTELPAPSTQSQLNSTQVLAIDQHPVWTRLRRYVEINGDTAEPSSSQHITDILTHLPTDPDVDPSSYDWRRTEADIRADRANAAKRSDPRARRRIEKRAQIMKRKAEEQKEDALIQQLPPVIGSYERVVPETNRPSSQVMGPEGNAPLETMAMTQPERGPFGARTGGVGQARKDKGKKRAAGF